LKSKFCPLSVGCMLYVLMRFYSEKDEIDLQLRAVPDLEERIKELESVSQ
jgi:hypothetical protein